MTRVVPAAAILLALSKLASAAADIRVCDHRTRHVDCHFQGGEHYREEVPAGESLSYSLPSLSIRIGNHVHIVTGSCEIDCEAPPPIGR